MTLSVATATVPVMNPQDLFLMSDAALRDVIDTIDRDQLSLAAPAEWSRKPNPTLRDIVAYHAFDEAWVPDVRPGRSGTSSASTTPCRIRSSTDCGSTSVPRSRSSGRWVSFRPRCACPQTRTARPGCWRRPDIGCRDSVSHVSSTHGVSMEVSARRDRVLIRSGKPDHVRPRPAAR